MLEMGNTVLIVTVVISGLCTMSECLKCYKCTTIDLPDKCGDDFKLNSTDTKYMYIDEDCEYCLKTIVKNTKTIVRNCLQKQFNKVSIRTGCSTQKDNGIESKTCACTSDLCNTAGTSFHPGTTFFPVYVCVILFVSLLNYV